ncbi:hypothetical protein VOLCADRAFT_100281 [Volvox carteri f. nagariensis]|uniref:RING-type domain-containing protein n=1 Tax=Volvox carteri f. nagariensis TaxID=3068 RepID=D8UJW8_VOLCA|nr:uncharacterized protein VOLCADRAFT_100281 [Volvox carteri f. nagariensis]EFJ39984.1 hypothetical protein VOLCADRAFT_100281 [Volvox carteri f. nagariensis]|eukprot:XP_002958949.1 hypothetical protein VOLCADRAFT_100281 [Volvox carteri f. nagariensis]
MDDYQYEQEVPADLLCAVCYHALREPRCCPRCQKGFCAECITTWASTQKRKDVPFSCPYCRARLRLSQLFRLEALEVRLGELRVLCPYGCSCTLRRVDLADHVALTCPGVPVRCPDCGTAMLRGQLAAHIGSSNCPNRRLTCPNKAFGCPVQLQLHDMPYHATNCPYEPMTCRHCHAVVLRGQAEEHCWAGCPALCPCPNRCYGCEHVASSLKQLADHVVRHCQYGESSAYMARMRAALGRTSDLVYGSSRFRSASDLPYTAARAGGAAATTAAAASASGVRHRALPHPQIPSVGLHEHYHPAQSFETCWPSGPGGLYGTGEGTSTAAGTWCHGLFVPASLYPNGLPPPPPATATATEPGSGHGCSNCPGVMEPSPPWPWLVDSTREVCDAAEVVLNRHFTFGAAAAVAAPANQLPRGQQQQQLLRNPQPEEQQNRQDQDQNPHQQEETTYLPEHALGWLQLVSSRDAGGELEDAAEGQQQQQQQELFPSLQELLPQCEGEGCPIGAQTEALPAADVYRAVIDLAARLYERGGGGGDGGGNSADGDGAAAAANAAAAAATLGEFPVPPPAGSLENYALALFQGEDNSLVDLPRNDTALHHGYRAFWALGLLRLCRRQWPSVRLHWRSLAALNDLTTALGRRLLSAVVEVLGCELVQESAPMGEGDVMLAVQTLFPAPLAAEALESVRHTLRMCDDAFWESDIWMEGWSPLRVKLELGLELGRVACLVAQYTPLHGQFMRGADDTESGDEEEEGDGDSDDDSDSDDTSDSEGTRTRSGTGDSDGGSGGGSEDEDDDGDIEAAPRVRAARGPDAAAAAAAAVAAPGGTTRRRHRQRSSSSGNSSGSSTEDEPPQPAEGHSRSGRRSGGASGGGGGGTVFGLSSGIRAPALELIHDARRRLRGLGIGAAGGGGGGGGGSSGSSGEWESINEEGFPDEMDVASSGSSGDTGQDSHADIRGVVALAAVMEWFVLRLLGTARPGVPPPHPTSNPFAHGAYVGIACATAGFGAASAGDGGGAGRASGGSSGRGLERRGQRPYVGCAVATSRVRGLAFEERMKLVGAVLRSAYEAACGSWREEAKCATGPKPEAAVVELPGDLVAVVTGGRLRGKLLQRLLPPALRPLLQPTALSYAARMANLGLTSGLLRIHHLDVPCWWRKPGSTALAAAMAFPAAGAAAAPSPALAPAVRPDPGWLQQLQSDLGLLRDVEAAAGLCRDLGAVLYGVPSARENKATVGGGAETSTPLPPPPAPPSPPPPVTPASGTDGIVGSSIKGNTGSSSVDSGGVPDMDPRTADPSHHTSVAVSALPSSSATPAAASEPPGELPLCIPRDVFMDVFQECWNTVRQERGGGAAAVPYFAAAGHAVAPLPGSGVAGQQQERALGVGGTSGPAAARRRRRCPSISAAMGMASDSPMRRRFRPRNWPRSTSGTAAAPTWREALGITAAGAAAPAAGAGGTAEVVAATAGSSFPDTGSASVDVAMEERGRQRQQGGGTAAAAETAVASAASGPLAEGGESEDWMDWSADALEVLHMAAEAALAEALREYGSGGGGGGV